MEDLRRQAVLALVTLREGGWIRGLEGREEDSFVF
jgi:hypothetical protein